MSADVLDVYLDGMLAGKLRQSGAELIFQYVPEYLAAAINIPLSLSLPFRLEPFSPEVSHQFFANLLPEGAVRDFVAQRHRVSPDNDFGLLAAIGGDCAGAVSLYPGGERPTDRTAAYRPLSTADLEKLSAEPFAAAPSFLSDAVLRLSLAGAQDKLPAALMDGQLCLPEGGAPSTHILKPRHLRFRSLPENEIFCMQLAARSGLPVPATSLLPAGDGFFLIERYDRRREPNGRIRRLHQEDFCQALEVPPARKYEAEGGPGFSPCFALLRRSREPIPARQRLIRWAIYNYLIGNADAHAKNISLLYDARSPALAPFYDLVCTAVYPLADHMAMSVGGAFDIRLLGTENWRDFARQAGERRETFVFQTIEEMALSLPHQGEIVAAELSETYGPHDIYGEILDVLRRRAAGLLGMLKQARS
jgi:serine/threonine-protein kinase HipA